MISKSFPKAFGVKSEFFVKKLKLGWSINPAEFGQSPVVCNKALCIEQRSVDVSAHFALVLFLSNLFK